MTCVLEERFSRCTMKYPSSHRSPIFEEDRSSKRTQESTTDEAPSDPTAVITTGRGSIFCALVVDPDAAHRRSVRDVLHRHGWEVREADSVEKAIGIVERFHPSLVFCDVYLQASAKDELGGLTVLHELKNRLGGSVHIVITAAHGRSTSALEAILNGGASDFMRKPCSEAKIAQHSRTVIRRLEAAVRETAAPHLTFDQNSSGLSTAQIVGESEAIVEVFKELAKTLNSNHYSRTDSGVDERPRARPPSFFITGETGTGKELIARMIHRNSSHAGGEFVPINCSTLPLELAESELFGHCAGAFTGAVKEKQGLWEVADGGTLFLDEITEAPASVQPKLLRALQEGVIKRVGANHWKQVNVQIVAASNRDMQIEVEAGRFRSDLYHRLSLYEIHLPPLRDRPEDIPLLVEHFARKYSVGKISFSAEAIGLLGSYWWPGNVRELENAVQRFINNAYNGRVLAVDIRDHLERLRMVQHLKNGEPEGNSFKESDAEGHVELETQLLSEIFKRAAREALTRHNGNKSRAARELGISRPSLYKVIRQVGASLNGRENL